MNKMILRPLVAVCALGAVFAASCSKSDSNNPSRRDMLIGNYYIYQTGNDSNSNGAFDASEKITTTPGVDRDSIAFKADGTGSTKMLGMPLAFSWTLENNDNNIKITIPGIDTVTAGILSVSSTSVTVITDISKTGIDREFATFNKY